MKTKNPKKPKTFEQLSHTQLRMLLDIRDGGSGDAGVYGMAQAGGASGTLASLRSRGLVVDGYVESPNNYRPTKHLVITASGRIALAQHDEI